MPLAGDTALTLGVLMTSLTWNQIIDSLEKPLSIPEGLETLSVLQAALKYADCGWYVLPINAATKHPGSLVGTAWPEKSTRNEAQIREMFRFPNTAIALHVGRSGAIALDVDDPSQLSPLLQRFLFQEQVPFQSTRLIGNSRRGHFLFKLPPNMIFGNSIGTLGSGWGDIRCHNGIIVVSPSQHAHHEGFYRWQRVGELPVLPQEIANRLPKRSSSSSSSALNLHEAREFIAKYNQENFVEQLQFRLDYLRKNPPSKSNRHTAFQRFLCLVLKDAAAGFYKASDALNETHALFNYFKPKTEQTPNEFEGMAYWAMGMVEAMTTTERALHAFQNAPHLDAQIMEWVMKNAK